MAFGLNRAEVIGRMGADVTINHLASPPTGNAPNDRRVPSPHTAPPSRGSPMLALAARPPTACSPRPARRSAASSPHRSRPPLRKGTCARPMAALRQHVQRIPVCVADG